MTILEATIAAVQIPGYSEIAVEKALIDYSLNAAGTYSVADKAAVNQAALVVLKGMLAVAETSEGDYTIKYSVDGIKARIKYLEDELGTEDNAQPKIRNASFYW